MPLYRKAINLTFIIFFIADDTASITSSEQAAILQTPDQSEGTNNTVSGFSNDLTESEVPPPQPLELESVAAVERKKMVSSYENVYTGVPLEPTVNRMSMDASEMDIGDRFDTKQSDSKLESGLSSSYEKLYEPAEKVDDEGESHIKSESMSCASAATGVSYNLMSAKHTTHPASVHSDPVYITVESGLDKLACSTKDSGIGASSTRIRADIVERSVSCDTTDYGGGSGEIFRPTSSPDVFSPVDPRPPLNYLGKGT